MRKDYCGPEYFPKFLRRFLSNKFNASCKIHDIDYDKSGFSRKESDKRFLKNMKHQAGSNIMYKMFAYAYYLGVRIGGIFSYKERK